MKGAQIVEILGIEQKKSQRRQVFPSYDQHEIVLMQNAYDIRNQHQKLQSATWISLKQINKKLSGWGVQNEFF